MDEMSSILRKGLSENRRHEGGNRTFKRRNMATVECYRCHEIGHYATDFPTRQPAVEEVVVQRRNGPALVQYGTSVLSVHDTIIKVSCREVNSGLSILLPVKYSFC